MQISLRDQISAIICMILGCCFRFEASISFKGLFTGLHFQGSWWTVNAVRQLITEGDFEFQDILHEVCTTQCNFQATHNEELVV